MEPLSQRVATLYAAYQVATWWATNVEIASAFARLHRLGQIDFPGLAKAQRTAADLESNWWDIPPSPAMRTEAALLLYRYDLRAADALQLAAALQWCEGKPTGRIFLTADDKLREAARFSGFDTSLL